MLRGGSSIQLMRIFGIRIGVDVSWFVVLFLFIFVLSGSFRSVLDSSDLIAYGTAVGAALLFFVSLVLHELGHALAARRLGIEIAGIDLWFFGGIAKMSRDTDSPGSEFAVAVAGPIVTLLIVVVCALGAIAFGGAASFEDAIFLNAGGSVSPELLLLSWLALINGVLLLFNLVPAFPLDGGRIARAIAWKATGDRNRATRIAAFLGQLFAYVLIGWGVFLALTGNLFDGLWSAVLGWFLLQAARAAVAQTAVLDRIDGVTVADIMDPEPVTIPAEATVARAQEEWFHRYRWPWFPVVDASHRYVGIIRQERVDGALTSGDGGLLIRDAIDQAEDDSSVSSDAPLELLLGSESLRNLGALFAVDPDGVLRGVVTLEQVRRALQRATVTPPAG